MDQLELGAPRHRGDPATPVRQWPPRPHRGPGSGQGDRCDPAESGFPRPSDLPPLRCRRTRLLRHRRESAARIGTAVRYEPIDIPLFAASLTARGATPFIVQHLSNVAQDYRDGIFAGKNNLVEVISGSKPMTVEEYVIANRSQFDTDGRYAVEDVLPPTGSQIGRAHV